jgi:hypothetical protein
MERPEKAESRARIVYALYHEFWPLPAELGAHYRIPPDRAVCTGSSRR